MTTFVLITPDELAAIVEAAVGRALATAREAAQSASPYLTVAATAERLLCTPRTVRRYIAMGKLVAVKTSEGGAGKQLVTRASLEYLEQVSR